jgi:heme exporter protein C
MTWIASLLIIVLGLTLPTGASYDGADMVARGKSDSSAGPAYTPVIVTVSAIDGKSITAVDRNRRTETIDISTLPSEDQQDLAVGTKAIIRMSRNPDGGYRARQVTWYDPPMALPLIPALRERARNIYFHVPVAWIAELAWVVAVFYSIRYLRRKDVVDDVKASSAAAIGLLFCILATVTGSIWARFDWNSFWSWDPRQVSILVVLVIYGAYFALRSAIPSTEQRGRISSVYLILMVIPVTFFIFIFPRLMPGLHPGESGSNSSGPILDSEAKWLDTTKQYLFALGFFAFTLIYFWLTNISVRTRLIEMKRRLSRGVGAVENQTPRG